MLSIKKEDLDRLSKEGLFEQLKKTVKLRNKMCGAMYWNILNDECCEIANRCLNSGISSSKIESLLGKGNFKL